MRAARPLNLAKTPAALAAFDAAGDVVDRVDAKDARACREALEAVEARRLELAQAFADDTADRNDRATVLAFVQCLAGMTFVRRMVASFEKKV